MTLKNLSSMLQNESSTPQGWKEGAYSEAWNRAKKILSQNRDDDDWSKYQGDPVRFCREALGDEFTQDVVNVINSVNVNSITIARSANSVGKSFAAARIAIYFLKCFTDAQVWLTAAPPERNLRDILWAHILDVKTRKPSLFAEFNDRRMKIVRRFNSLSFLEGVSIPMQGTAAVREAKFSGKHAPHLIFIVDEGDAVPEEVYKGIESCMTSEYVRLLVLFNPRAPTGIIYEMEKKGLANVVELSALRHPNVITGKDVIPGAVSRGVTVRRINEWTRPLSEDEDIAAAKREESGDPDKTIFSVPKYLENSVAVSTSGNKFDPLPMGRRKILEDGFYYMVLGQYPGIGSKQLIADSWIDDAVNRRKNYVALYGEIPPPGILPVIGADIAEFGGDNNCACIRYGGFVAQFRVWAGLDPDQSADKLVEIHLEVNADTSKIDGMGVGSGVAPRMVRTGRDKGYDISAWSVKVSEKPSKMTHTELGEFYSMRDEMAWRCREWLRLDPTAMLPDDPMLKEELKALEYDYFGGGKIKLVEKKVLRERLKRSPDRADSLMMSFAPFERALVVTVEEQKEIMGATRNTGEESLDEWRKRQDKALLEMAQRM